jgi:N4-gp56 family major capsid protein
MSTTNYGAINQRTAAWAATEMLSHAEPVIVLNRFGQPKPLPKNKAKTVKFRRPIPFASVHDRPLVEGVTPVAQQMQYEDVEATIKQYGASLIITDVVQDLAEDPALKDSSMLSGEQAAETIEMVTWGMLRAGTNVFYANSTDTLRSDVNDPISLGVQRKITRFLKAQRTKKITQMVGASPNFNTAPIDAAFIAVGHSDLESDIRGMSGFVPVEEYGQMKALPYECGKVEDVRYVLSPLLDPFTGEGSATLNGMIATGSNVDVYPIIYLGKEFFGNIPLKGSNAIKPMVLNPGMPSKSDPLGQRGYVSWKAYFTAVILNEAWGCRLECGVTENP